MARSLCFSVFIQMFFLYAWLLTVAARNYSHSRVPRCHADERSALLEFKASFMLANIPSDPLAHPKTLSWQSNRDCCLWDGIECDENTSHVIVLDLSGSSLYGSINATSSLFQLVHLEKLNLSHNDFNYSHIPSRISKLSKLTHLDLSASVFYGRVPSEIFRLRRLVYLNLCCNLHSHNSTPLLEMKLPGLSNLAHNLTNLEELFLDYVTISSIVPECLTNLTTLRRLSMNFCGIYGVFPARIFNLPKLSYIRVGTNFGLTGHLPEFNLSIPLEELWLDETSFEGKLPASIGNLQALHTLNLNSERCNLTGLLPPSIGDLLSLTYLGIAGCKFVGSIPSSIGNLSKLECLDITIYPLSTQPISSLSWVWKLNKLKTLGLRMMKLEGEIPSSIGNLSHLATLHINGSQLSGPIPPQIANLTKLTELILTYNQLTGFIPSELMNMTQLTVLSLDDNLLQGRIPSSIFKLQNLEFIALSENNLSGTVELDSFLKLKKLQYLQLSFNRLSCLTSSTNPMLPQFRGLGLASCNLSEFPTFLQNQRVLNYLDLSDNNIKGEVPMWVWNSSFSELQFLNLSHNYLTTFDRYRPINPLYMYTMDLSYNMLKGLPPEAPPSIMYYFVSNNTLTGPLPPWICNLSSAIMLDLSANNLTGVIPNCLENSSKSLSMLNLGRNKFYGRVHDLFARAVQLIMIDLSHNLLEGKLPRSLTNSKMLEFINFGNNRMNDTFPSWMGSLPELKVLILRSNNFQGVIKESNFSFMFPKLKILDLSHNSFTGKLPMEFFQCLNAMKIVDPYLHNLTYLQTSFQPRWPSKLTNLVRVVDQSSHSIFVPKSPLSSNYHYSMIVIYKGLETNYPKILDDFTMLDLSRNSFEGDITDSIGNLQGLHGLNLSSNVLTGHIPPSLGNISALESLDLSHNKLSGQIPEELMKLGFLSLLNVSFNNLTGHIPRGGQLDTFSDASFEGNSGLCGEFISKKCQDSLGSQKPASVDQDNDSRSRIELDWKIILMGFVSGLVVGVVLENSFILWKSQWFIPNDRRRRLVRWAQLRRGRN